jgi:hypothetical protein
VSTSATPDIFARRPDLVLERREKRVEYVQYRDEKCIAPLWKVGRVILGGFPVPDDQRRAYVEAVLTINKSYFEARGYEDRIEGRYHKFDDESERRVREVTADGLSESVTNLRALGNAHEALREALPDEERDELEPRLFLAGKRVLAGGWFPTLETYYQALDPGDYIAEGIERRKRRIEGEGRRPGVRDLLQGPLFKALTSDDLDTIKDFDWRAPGKPSRFVNYLEGEFSFMIQQSKR